MKKVFYLVAASLLMTSCLEDKTIEAYNEDFVSVFGDTDPLHTWKMVDNKAIEVNLDKSSRVKVYVKVGSTYRLAADYENVSGTRTLSYDAPLGCEDIHVTVDGVPYQKANSRTEDSGTSTVGIEQTGVYKYFTYGDFHKYYYEGNSLPEDGQNKDKLTGMDYKVVMPENVDSYRFYPIYWGAEYFHSYGLYYYDASGIKKEIPFIDNFKTGGLIQRIVGENEQVAEGVNVYVDENGRRWIDVHPDYAFKHLTEGNVSYNDNDVILRSKCYNIILPKGAQFGFFVDIKKQNQSSIGRFYSDPELNDATQSNSSHSAFAYLIKDGITYITVEDSEDTDYNDFVFVLEGVASPVIEDPVQFIYAVEDLGGTNDFDFNDIVFSVSHVAGKENATVQPLAAGGIYPATIRFTITEDSNEESNEDSNENRTTPYGEIHDMFGVKSNVMVNTTNGTMIKAKPFLVNVGAGWSHAAYGNSGNGFSVKVNIPDRVDKNITTYVPGQDIAPQMLVLSENWLWPTEKTRISDAYSGFGQWGADYSVTNWEGYYDEANKSWVSKHTAGKVVHWKE